MQTLILGSYVLIWPLVSFTILVIIGVATWKDIQKARREKSELV